MFIVINSIVEHEVKYTYTLDKAVFLRFKRLSFYTEQFYSQYIVRLPFSAVSEDYKADNINDFINGLPVSLQADTRKMLDNGSLTMYCE